MATELLSVKAVAGEAGISRQALEKHMAAERIAPDFNANSRSLFLPESVERVNTPDEVNVGFVQSALIGFPLLASLR